MRFLTFPLATLSVAELSFLARKIIEVIRMGSKSNDDFEKITTKLQLQLDELFGVLNRKPKSGTSQKLRELRADVLKRLRILRIAIESQTSDAGELTPVGDELLLIIKEHSNLHSRGYSVVNEMILMLLKKLDGPRNKALLEMLDVESQLERLKESQLAMQQAIINAADINSELSQQRTASSLKPDIVQTIRDLFAFLSINKDDDGWKDLTSDIRALLAQARNDLPKQKKETDTNKIKQVSAEEGEDAKKTKSKTGKRKSKTTKRKRGKASTSADKNAQEQEVENSNPIPVPETPAEVPATDDAPKVDTEGGTIKL